MRQGSMMDLQFRWIDVVVRSFSIFQKRLFSIYSQNSWCETRRVKRNTYSSRHMHSFRRDSAGGYAVHVQRLLWVVVFSVMCINLAAQAEQKQYKFWVYFTDKKDTPYNIHKPAEFLSAKALQRRAHHGVAVTEQDLPVNPLYVNTLRQKGAVVYHTSKWFNTATIMADSTTAMQLKTLAFVDSVEYLGKHVTRKRKPSDKGRDFDTQYFDAASHYGAGYRQIQMLNGHVLHGLGYRGEGMLVAVLDGGFTNVDIMPVYDSLRANDRLFVGHDFVDNDKYLYESSNHGSQVMSTMASNIPGFFVGSAPDATYICMKTEDVRSESYTEEANWIAAAEMADSMGVDVINSSLGYTTFNDKRMNYDHAKMNGKTAKVSRAADIAFSKGMIVVNSAGNEGNSKWYYIGAPADAENVLAVAATKSDGSKAPFSSFGPAGDGRIKPDVAAMGMGIIVSGVYDYRLLAGNGTSFASPLTAGMVTSLWQAFPERTNAEILEAVRFTARQADSPDEDLGYGIANFYQAFEYLNTDAVILPEVGMYGFFSYLKTIFVHPQVAKDCMLYVYNSTGQLLLQKQCKATDMKKFYKVELAELEWPVWVRVE